MKTTLAVAIPHTVDTKGAKAASASAWRVGKYPIKDHAERIVAHVAGRKIAEYVSRSGGFINSRVDHDNKRIFDVDDMVEAKAGVSRHIKSLVGEVPARGFAGSRPWPGPTSAAAAGAGRCRGSWSPWHCSGELRGRGEAAAALGLPMAGQEGRHAPGAWMWGDRWLIAFMSVRPDYLGAATMASERLPEPAPILAVMMPAVARRCARGAFASVPISRSRAEPLPEGACRARSFALSLLFRRSSGGAQRPPEEASCPRFSLGAARRH